MGNDTLTGGSDSNLFWLYNDVITDATSADILRLNSMPFNITVSALTTQQRGNDVILTIGTVEQTVTRQN